LNSGIQDVYDLSWKLTAVLKGYGGERLLDAYNYERRSVAELNVKMAERATMEVILPIMTYPTRVGPGKLIAQDNEGEKARAELTELITKGRWMLEQDGITLGYRYNGSPLVIPDPTSTEPPQSITAYIPSTWPGSRAPHVFLADGKTSIFDLYGPDFTIVDFMAQGQASELFESVARDLQIPLTRLHLPNEAHCRGIWERDLVLVRPDGFAVWRAPSEGGLPANEDAVKNILKVAVGKETFSGL
jgi:hypothetical protein